MHKRTKYIQGKIKMNTYNDIINPLLLTDSYKLGHADQYPDGTEFVVSNFTPRSFKHADSIFINVPEKDRKVVVFGLQAVLLEMNALWDSGFFERDEDTVVGEFIDFIKPYAPSRSLAKMDARVRELHRYGKLPIKVNALPEGSLNNS